MLKRNTLTLLLSMTLASAPLVARADGPAARADPQRAYSDVLTLAEAALLQGQSAQAAALALSALDQVSDSPAALKESDSASCATRTERSLRHRRPDAEGLLHNAVRAWQGLPLAAAAPPPAGPRLDVLQARKLHARALKRLQGNNFEEALPLLQQAYKLEHRPQLLFEMARCYVHTGQMALAVAAHQRYTQAFTAPAERLVAAARFGALVQEIRSVR